MISIKKGSHFEKINAQMAIRDDSGNDEPLNEAEGNTPLDKDYSKSQSLESTVANNIFNDCTFNFENSPATSNFSSQLTIALIIELIILIPALLFQNLSQEDESFTGAILNFVLSFLIILFTIALIVTIVWWIWEKVNKKQNESESGGKEIQRLIDYVRDSIIAEGNTEN